MALQIIDGQLTNRHHHQWPKKKYTLHPPPGIDVDVSRRYRNLPCKSVQMEIRKHIQLHLNEEPPPIPTQAEMEAEIRAHDKKRCSCFVEDPAPVVVVSKRERRKKTKKQTRRSGKPRTTGHRGGRLAYAH